ncbi:MAG TPA: NAD(P)-dependent oxidoreductase [Verrucomicrobiae bacterium]|nr:NAD(P)-dependent oxidoreductase [Verrucomicrobiae bacterium]
MNSVFLNAARLDFDGTLDFSPLEGTGRLTRHDDTRKEEIALRVRDQQVVITKELPLERGVIEAFPPSVKLICEAGTGYNNIDVAAARERGITVCNVPGYSTGAVAQLAITLVLGLASSLAVQQRMLERRDLSNFHERLLVPHTEVAGKTLGVIGGGSIATAVMKIARSLDMNILVCTRTAKNWEDPQIRAAALEELLAASDYVSIHCPLTPETRHLISSEKLKLMKPSACLVNTSRGAIVKEDDLVRALREGTIAGAALDVQDPEPPETASPLYAMDNVILTPHIGWKARETRQRLIGLTAANIESFSRGSAVNLVN